LSNFSWSSHDVAAALGLTPDGEAERRFARVSTDTRAVEAGDLFVALVGERFDAHDFLGQAAAAGATGAVVSRLPEETPEGMSIFLVDNSLHALGALARYRRRALDGRVVGVVGSNGKTSTKDLVRAALSPRYRVHATQGNFNNQIGAPLTLLAAPEDAEVVVVEMGTNEPGEIEILTRIVEPDTAVVTSIGEEHLEKLGSVEGVLEEELAVLRGLPAGAVAFVAEEPFVLPERAKEILSNGRVLVAGFSPDADLHPEGGLRSIVTEPDGSTRWRWAGHEVHLPMPGRWNVRNALLALGVARELGVGAEEAARAIAGVGRAKLRGEWLRVGDLRVLADCYNSNPPSLAAAVDLLASLPAEGQKVAVVGTMREMGESTASLHRRAAEDLAARLGHGVDLVVATGAFVPAFRDVGADGDERVVAADSPLDAYDQVAGRLRGDEIVLLKASRGEALERWIPLLERDFGRVKGEE
jgi:UDP-N-acetylmuramoyl-tripeptide--D-alanyl-D-alanine ligase